MFAFDLYDSDGSGEISPTEVTQMLTDLFGKQDVKTNQHAKAYVTFLYNSILRFETSPYLKLHPLRSQNGC